MNKQGKQIKTHGHGQHYDDYHRVGRGSKG